MDAKNSLLTKYTMLAKHIIYDTNRMLKLKPMMDSPDGAVLAVKTVMGAIEQSKPIPPELAPNLAVNIYLLIVDMLQEATGLKASPDVMKKVINNLLTAVGLTHSQPKSPAPNSGQGIIAQAQQGVPA